MLYEGGRRNRTRRRGRNRNRSISNYAREYTRVRGKSPRRDRLGRANSGSNTRRRSNSSVKSNNSYGTQYRKIRGKSPMRKVFNKPVKSAASVRR